MDYTTSLFCICLLLLPLSKKCFSIPPGVLREVCLDESFIAECETGEVVVMEKALYGRMRFARCMRIDYGYLGCYADVLGLADQKCSGRQSCSIRIPDDDFDRVHPCPKEIKTYFEGSYRCVKVVEVQHELCRASDFFKLTSPSGFIASSSVSSGCGSENTPWIIEAQPGQVILVSIMNFGYWSVALRVCRVYAVLREKASSRSITICGGSFRIRDFYLTEGNSLEVWILKQKGAQFLLGWKVLGCPDPQVPPSGHISREGDKAVVTCDNSKETWHLTCNGTSWIGNIGNCTSLSSGSTKDNPTWAVVLLALVLCMSSYGIHN